MTSIVGSEVLTECDLTGSGGEHRRNRETILSRRAGFTCWRKPDMLQGDDRGRTVGCQRPEPPAGGGDDGETDVLLTMPRDASSGEHITVLVIENENGVKGSGSVAVDQVVRQAIGVVITVSGPAPVANHRRRLWG